VKESASEHRVLQVAGSFSPVRAQQNHPLPDGPPLYKQAGVPVEKCIDDLMRRMTLEEKVRQLDMYSGATELMSKHSDSMHAAPDAVFLPPKAQLLWGNLGVDAIHDLNPTPEQANAIQEWVISHNRLGIPSLFIEEGQLYLREDVSSVETPVRALKGFSRIHINPGEAKAITFRVPQKELEVWNAEKKWAIEGGECTVWAGGSSQATLSARFDLKP
jgi:Fibronectin type III-like domain